MKQSIFETAFEELDKQNQTVLDICKESNIADDMETCARNMPASDEIFQVIKDEDESVNDGLLAINAMNDLADILDESSSDGVDPVTADVIALATENIYRRLGVKAPKLAVENFGQTKTRREATRLALEDIGEVIKNIWIAIKAAFKRVYIFIKRFIENLFDSNRALAKDAVAMQKKVSLLDENADPKELSIVPKTSINALMNENNLIPYVKITQFLENSIKVTMNSNAQNNSYASWLSSNLNLVSLAKNQSAFDALPVFDFSNGYKLDNVTKRFVSPLLPGNKTICIQQPITKSTDGESVIGNLTKTYIYTTDGNLNAANKVTFNKVIVLPISSMKEMLEIILKITHSLDQGQAAGKHLEDAHAKCSSELEKILAMKDTDRDVNHRTRLLQTMITQVNRLVNESITVVRRTTLKSAIAAFDYVDVSSRQYKQKFA